MKNQGAGCEFGIDEWCIRHWRTEKPVIGNIPKSKYAQQGRNVAWTDMEDELEKWIF